jgi:pimeloyl-ACP methyl ester carboxylesterase
MEEKDITVNGKRVHFAACGKGSTSSADKPSIILVHGWCNNWMGWIPLMEQLKDKYTLYAIDQMGFGKSSRLSEYSVTTQADFLAGFIKKLDKKPLAVCGLSLGTFIVADFGLRYPKLTKKLILIGAVLPIGRRRKIIGRIMRKGLETVNGHTLREKALKKIIEPRLTAYIVSKYLNMYKFNRFLIDAYGLPGRKEMSRQAFVQMGISAASYRLDKTINSLPVKTLLVYGSNDKFTRLNEAKKILLRDDFSYVQIPQSGHITSLEQPRLVAREINKFLATSKLT